MSLPLAKVLLQYSMPVFSIVSVRELTLVLDCNLFNSGPFS